MEREGQGLVQRWTGWAGGPWALLAILLVQAAVLGVATLSGQLAAGLIVAAVAVILVLEYPLLGVALLLFARLLSTGATVFFRIGHMGIGPFEPALVLVVGALVVHAATHGVRLWRPWPWRGVFLALFGWVVLSLFWCVDKRDGIGDVIPLVLVLANSIVMFAFLKEWRHVRWMIIAWVLSTLFIALLTAGIDVLGIKVGTVQFKAAAGGGRDTGLGQQPNWYAMNLMFGVLPAFGLAAVDRKPLLRLAWLGVGLFTLFMMLKSGSRGSAYALVIGASFMALGNDLFRRWALRLGAFLAVAGVAVIAVDFGGAAKALLRITSNLSIEQNYRPLNWQVCAEMLRDTWGRGIGAGGYEELLPQYNNYLATSLYNYPHGIFWDVMAHYGIAGIGLLVALVVVGGRMTRDLVRWTRGTEVEAFVWTLAAGLLGYAAWSWVEFTLVEKPFWEFLSLYTALYLVVARSRAEATTLPPWPGRP